MLALTDGGREAHPADWAPFVVVGEGGAPPAPSRATVAPPSQANAAAVNPEGRRSVRPKPNLTTGARNSCSVAIGRSAVGVARRRGRFEAPPRRGPPAASVELGALLDGKRHVVDVAFDTRRGLQRHGHGANNPGDASADDHPLSRDRTCHLALLADDQLGTSHVAFDLAVDLQRAPADDLEPLADDLEVVADDGLAAALGRPGADLGRPIEAVRILVRIRLQRLERHGLGRGATREHGISPR